MSGRCGVSRFMTLLPGCSSKKILYKQENMMRIRAASIILLSAFYLNTFFINAQDLPPTTSLVYPGTDGKLVYVADSLGNRIPDFSYAGYKGGGVRIPHVPVKEIVWP